MIYHLQLVLHQNLTIMKNNKEMNILTTFLVLLLSISPGTSQLRKETTQSIVIIDEPEIIKGFVIEDKEYTLHFNMEKAEDQNYTLVIDIELHNESYFVSPNATRDFSGKFYMDLGSYTQIDFKGDIEEAPRSIEEFDSHPFVDGTVNWVRVNTTYKQSLELKSQEDFEVFGRVQFTIEPRCTFEEIPFAISYQNGVMKITSPKC